MKKKPFDKHYSVGGWIDESLPALCEFLEGLNLEKEDFLSWLASELGELRFEDSIKFSSISDQKAVLKKMISTLDGVLAFSQSGAIPPEAEAAMITHAHYRDFSWRENMSQLQKAALNAHFIASRTLDDYENAKGRRGAPSKSRRDALLVSLVDRLQVAGSGVAESRDLAARILRRCGVDVPEDERDLRRIIKDHSGGE